MRNIFNWPLRKWKLSLLWDSISFQSEILSSKHRTADVVEGTGEEKPSSIAGRCVNQYSHYGTQDWSFLKNRKKRHNYHLNQTHHFWVYTPSSPYTVTETLAQLLTVAACVIARKCSQFPWPSMNNDNGVWTMSFYSAVKKEVIMRLALEKKRESILFEEVIQN